MNYVASVQVEKFIKAELFSHQEAKKIQVHNWKKPAKGEAKLPKKGDWVRLYMTKDKTPADTYQLLNPNGWELMDNDPEFLSADLDDWDDERYWEDVLEEE